MGKGASFVIPDDERLPQSIDVVRISDRGQTVISAGVSGQKVVAEFNEKEPNKVNVIEILNVNDSVSADVLGIIRSYRLYEEFPDEVLSEARHVAKLDPEEISRREDLRESVIITIDPADAKDLDDAVSLEINKDGTYELGVHIADVSHYVRDGSLLDAEAYKRGTSVYFPGGVLPMLPQQLSNNICSLNQDVDRLALSCFMTIDKFGKIIKSRVSETVIRSNTRFSYDTVQKILDGDEEECKIHKKVVPMLNDMAVLTKVLEEIRRQRGEVIFDLPEPQIILDEKTGKIADVVAYPHLLAHRIIETFMIVCNETIAEFALDRGLPFIYRIHERPDPAKIEHLSDMLKPFGIFQNFNPEHVKGQEIQKIVDKAEGDLKTVISSLCLRSMQKAKYSAENLGHFGLGSKNYCHFTSPIRRLPDLLIHRIIKLMLENKTSSHKIEELNTFVVAAADQSSKTELVAVNVEREVDNLKRAEFMNDHIGDVFSGIVSGVTEFGVFVYLLNTVEGLIKMENLPRGSDREYYRFNEKNGTMSSPKRTIKMGDKIDVICAGVNLPRRQVEFAAVNKQ